LREDVVAAATAVLRRGGVVALPTETVYGLVTLWGNEAGRRRIFDLKQRSEEKQLQMLAGSLPQALGHGVLDDPRLRKLAEWFWPGPLTAVCRGTDGGTVGLRLPRHALILALLDALGEPLAATSANRSGEPAAADAHAAVAHLAGAPDLLVDGGPITAAQASTVISLVDPQPKLVRPGPVSLEEILLALR
jgi:L-threonylcarbamoyladenylate synthase